jgi:uncharacterized protein
MVNSLIKQGYIRTIVNKPEGEGPFPAVFYLQGYTCASIDNLAPTSTLKQLIEGLVEKGYAVFRMEKPGVGDSYNLPDCMHIDYETEINAFKKGLENLQEISFVDKSNIFLFGHSLGGNCSPLDFCRKPAQRNNSVWHSAKAMDRIHDGHIPVSAAAMGC